MSAMPYGVSNHQPHDCLLFNRLFRRRSKEISKLRVTGLCAGIHRGPVNSPHQWPVTRKMFAFRDVIMVHEISSAILEVFRKCVLTQFAAIALSADVPVPLFGRYDDDPVQVWIPWKCGSITSKDKIVLMTLSVEDARFFVTQRVRDLCGNSPIVRL